MLDYRSAAWFLSVRMLETCDTIQFDPWPLLVPYMSCTYIPDVRLHRPFNTHKTIKYYNISRVVLWKSLDIKSMQYSTLYWSRVPFATLVNTLKINGTLHRNSFYTIQSCGRKGMYTSIKYTLYISGVPLYSVFELKQHIVAPGN